MRYVLASDSPRRKEILTEMGIEFSVVPSDVDERICVTDPKKLVTQLALLKATDVAKKFYGERVIVIAADTVVALGDNIMGKPKDEEDAFAMLSLLSGKSHSVYTGYCVCYAKNGNTTARCEKTDVVFKHLTDKEILDYIKTGEPMDKAGSYAIQGLASAFISEIKGDFFNVVGLPKDALLALLQEEFGFEGR